MLTAGNEKPWECNGWHGRLWICKTRFNVADQIRFLATTLSFLTPAFMTDQLPVRTTVGEENVLNHSSMCDLTNTFGTKFTRPPVRSHGYAGSTPIRRLFLNLA
jgi:hypothetical protein